MKRIIVGLAAAFALAAPGTAAAEVINLTFSGKIMSAVGTSLGALAHFPLGTDFSVNVSYNPNAAPRSPSSPHEYSFLSSSLTVGETTLATRVSDPGAISVFDNVNGSDRIVLSVALEENQYSSTGYSVALSDDSQTALTSSRLPTNLSLERFQATGFLFSFTAPDEGFEDLWGRVTDASVTSVPTAPEPSTTARV
jgi:hypothetical protein